MVSKLLETAASLSAQDKAFIGRIARRIYNTGLVTPAVFFLEMVKPLSLLGSHALVFWGPIVSAFVRTEGYYRAAELLENPATIEFLITAIEDLENRGEG